MCWTQLSKASILFFRRYCLLSLLLYISCATLTELVAQDYVRIEGRVLDEQDRSPLAFAHMVITNTSVGTTTNEEGFFVLQFPSSSQRDSLKISYLGYHSKMVPLNQLRVEGNMITLSTEGVRLEEVVVRPDNLDPIQLIKTMLQQVRKNYPQKPKNSLGFFRETIHLSTDPPKEVLYAEGVLEFHKTAYRGKNHFRDAVRVLKGNRKPLFYGYLYGKDTLSLPAISQGSHLGVIGDVLKERPDFLQEGFSQRYQFKHLGFTNLDTFSLHVIHFKPVSGKKAGNCEGKLYIDANSMALVKASYFPTQQTLVSYNEYHATEQKLPIRLESRILEITYGHQDGLWHLQSGQVLNRYVDIRTQIPFTNKMNLVITEIKEGKGKPIPRKETIHQNGVFAVQVETPSVDFWEGYNVIATTPTSPTAPPKLDFIELKPADWVRSLDVAKTLAKEKNKLILIDFWASWCGPCKKMDREVWSDPSILDLKSQFIPVKLDVDRYPSVGREFEVRLLPTVMIIDPWGEIYQREESYLWANTLAGIMESYPSQVEKLYSNLDQSASKRARGSDLLQVVYQLQLHASTAKGSAQNAFIRKSTTYLKQAQKVLSRSDKAQYAAQLEWLTVWQYALRGQKKRALERLEQALEEAIPDQHKAMAYYIAVRIYRDNNDTVQATTYLELLRQCTEYQDYLTLLNS